MRARYLSRRLRWGTRRRICLRWWNRYGQRPKDNEEDAMGRWGKAAAIATILASAGAATGQAPPVRAQTPATAPTPVAARPARPPAPQRDPNAPGFVKAKELPDGAVPPAN